MITGWLKNKRWCCSLCDSYSKPLLFQRF